MIVPTGANRHLGRLVMERVLHRVPASEIGVSVRNPQAAQGLTENA